MSLTGGLIQDVRPYHQPNGSWRWAKNILLSKGFQSITNEEGFDLKHTTTGKIVIGVVKFQNDLVIFSTDNVKGEIGLIENDGAYVKIIDSIHLNFNTDNPIEGVAKKNFQGELLVNWSDGLNDSANPPRLLNITNLPFELDGALEFVDSRNANLTFTNPDVAIPIVRLSSIINSGSIPNGSLQFAIAYNFINNDRTSFHIVTNPISSSEDGGSIILNITNLDISFESFKLVVINKLATETNVFEIGDFDINNGETNVTYSGQNIASSLTIEDVAIGTNTFERVHTMTTLKDELIYANTKVKAIDYQCYANNIEVEWDVVDLRTTRSNVLDDDDSALYEKEFRQEAYRTFMPNEVYALYIHWLFNDGSVSEASHIPGRESNTLPTLTTAQLAVEPEPYEYGPNFPIRNSDTGTYWVWIPSAWIDGGIPFVEERVTSSPYNSITVGNTVEVFITYDSSLPATAPSAALAIAFNYYQRYTVNLNSNPYDVKSYEIVSVDAVNNIVQFKITLDTDPNTFVEPATGLYQFFDYNDYDEDKLLINAYSGTTALGGAPSIVGDLLEKNSTLTQYQLNDTSNVATGKLAFWKNLNEVYPNGEYSKVCDINGNEIGDLGGQNVRHHKMPSLVSIYNKAIDNNIEDPVDDIRNKFIIGLKLKNVVVPQELIGKVKGYVLSYAKRNITNQTVLGTSTVLDSNFYLNDVDNPNDARFYSKELLEFKPTITPDFYSIDASRVGAVLTYNSTTNDFNVVEGVEYSPQGSPSGNPDREAHLRILNLTIGSASVNTAPIISLRAGLADVFNPYFNQNIVSTKTLNPITTSQVYESDLIFGGDIFIRVEELEIQTGNQTTPPDWDIETLLQEVHTYISPAFIDADPNYNSVNDIQGVLPFNPKFPTTDIFPYRVFRSVRNFNESLTVGWRTFLTNEYYDMPRNKGVIWKLETLNRTLLIQHEFALFTASIKDVLRSDNITSYLGEGDIFDRTPDEILSEDNGYIGCQSKWAAFTCKLGYVTVDRNQGKIFLYSGQGLNEISNIGNRNFFKDSLETTENLDNPFIGMGITACYDEKWNRLLICKNIKKTNGEGKYDYSYTVSYTPTMNQGKGGWVSLHDYIPHFMINTRNNVLSVDNIANESSLYKHNIEGKKAVFYDGITYESSVDLVFIGQSRDTKIWEAVYWNSSIIQADNTKNRSKTITGILVYNDYQCSGIIVINDKQAWFKQNAIGGDEEWSLNSFRDLVLDKDLPFIDFQNELILTNIGASKSWINKNKFISKFGIVRFIYDNVIQDDFHLNDAMFKNRIFNKKD